MEYGDIKHSIFNSDSCVEYGSSYFRNKNKHQRSKDKTWNMLKFDPAGWPERKSLVTSKVSSSGSTLHHASFRPSHLDSPQEPAKDRVAPLRLIALRRSSQWRNHQNSKREELKLKEPCKISLSAYSSILKSVKKCSKRTYLRIC